ncbi:Uncharacterised protein [Kluyvera cryocrescens]|uniref:HTH-type transcriptional repressor NicS C-terminal domain-containing protein n=1 Tax=Kluyvera cryocrescens TaxID=580 RepID=A0A485BQI6_KLUCR|nr:Uncharacterised protein [Kluyvera cryocrescens]
MKRNRSKPVFSPRRSLFLPNTGWQAPEWNRSLERPKRPSGWWFTILKTKEQLYQAVLLYVYTRIRETEQQLGLENQPPVEALVQLVKWSVRYHAEHADFMRIICMENMQRGKWLLASGDLKRLNKSALSLLEHILHRGQEQGIFQPALEARDVHRLISSFSFYQVSNFYSFNSLYLDGPLPDIDDEALITHHCELAVKAILRFVIA